jgi:transcriptional regulator with GAF, ATPase, and Fis domain
MPEAAEIDPGTTALDLVSRLRLETFLADLTARLVTLPAPALPLEIDRALAVAVEVLDVDRCGLALFSPDKRALLVEHTHARPGVAALQGDLAPLLPWWTEQLRRGQRMVFSFVSQELPPEAEAERRFAADSGLKSHTVLPLAVGEEVMGAFGVASFSRARTWPTEFLDRLELLASVFAHACYRHRTEQRIATAEELNRAILAALPNAVLVLDSAGRVLTLNDAARSVLPGSPELLEGADYAAALEEALGSAGGQIAAELRAVLQGQRPSLRGTVTVGGAARPSHHLLHAVPLVRGQGTVVVHTDVTELHQTRSELEKTLREVEELRDRLYAENLLLHREVQHVHGFETIVGRSPALGRVLSQVEQVAPTDSPVLLLGETGTGKDVVARALHERSRRRERPLVTVNCAALPTSLIESELFGYEKGAFTGALQRTIGRFEIADKGTLFLDEIGELPLEVQAKLLRVLQSGEFERLGSPRTLKTSVRLIAATNRDLEREVREGRFRADLYYRLSVFPVQLPPLRARPEDIPLLAWHFVSHKQARLGRSIKRIPDRLMRTLTSHSWPGNVRELENVIERALILSEGSVLADPVLLAAGHGSAPAGGGTLEDVERAYIRAVLVECNWKVAGPGNAAERLGLNRSTLQVRMKKLGIQRPAREA